MESINNVDYVILVTEPTPFGFHDLKIAVEVLQNFNIPGGVIVNRSDLGDDKVQAFCDEQRSSSCSLRFHFQRKIAEGYARGQNLIETVPELRKGLNDVLTRLITQKV